LVWWPRRSDPLAFLTAMDLPLFLWFSLQEPNAFPFLYDEDLLFIRTRLASSLLCCPRFLRLSLEDSQFGDRFPQPTFPFDLGAAGRNCCPRHPFFFFPLVFSQTNFFLDDPFLALLRKNPLSAPTRLTACPHCLINLALSLIIALLFVVFFPRLWR